MEVNLVKEVIDILKVCCFFFFIWLKIIMMKLRFIMNVLLKSMEVERWE